VTNLALSASPLGDHKHTLTALFEIIAMFFLETHQYEPSWTSWL